MGYLTEYNGGIIANTFEETKKEKEVAEAISRLSYYKGCIKSDEISCIDDVIGGYGHKWYDWKEDMIEISKQFPDITIYIHGEGEDREDIWDCYFKGGLTAYYKAEIIMPKFNPKDFA